jgi:hypothetical protein
MLFQSINFKVRVKGVVHSRNSHAVLKTVAHCSYWVCVSRVALFGVLCYSLFCKYLCAFLNRARLIMVLVTLLYFGEGLM